MNRTNSTKDIKSIQSIKRRLRYFSKGEWLLWGISSFLIVFSFLLLDRENYMTLLASLVGVTSLIFNAKGNPIGQALMVLFSIFYGIISYSYAYYGEMITYLGMSMPMAVFALISWLRHPYKGNHAEVKIGSVKGAEQILMWFLAAAVTAGFYFVLKYLNTANLFFSTVSVTTSFLAVYLTFRRSPYYAVGYAANDIVLIILWTMAAMEKPQYLSVVVCFFAFLANDIYGFINWQKMGKRQSAAV